MRLLTIFAGVIRRLFLDVWQWLTIVWEKILNHTLFLSLAPRLFLLFSFLLVICLLIPLASYNIFGETHYLRHPKMFIAPFVFIFAFLGTWWESKYELVLRVASMLFAVFIAVYALIPSLFVPASITDYSLFIGFFLFIILFLLYFTAFVFSLLSQD